jgi:hypothetical protein
LSIVLRAILCHPVPNPYRPICNFHIAVWGGDQALARVAQEEYSKERSVEETAMVELLPMFVEGYLLPNEARLLAPRTEPKKAEGKAAAKKGKR